jgi:hypothetical protein
MGDWTLTQGLQNLRTQINTAFPNRDKISDGTIGDTLHKLHPSGHNPDDTPGSKPSWDGDPDNNPEVRAWDMDSDLNFPGVSTQDLVDHIRKLPNLETHIRYIIYNHTMYHYLNNYEPAPYTGTSPHTEHVHFEGQWTQPADNDTTFNYRLETLIMTPQDIADAVWAYMLKNAYSNQMQEAGTILRYIPSRNEEDIILARVEAIEAKMDEVLAKLNAQS